MTASHNDERLRALTEAVRAQVRRQLDAYLRAPDARMGRRTDMILRRAGLR